MPDDTREKLVEQVLHKVWADPLKLWAYSDKHFRLEPFGELLSHGVTDREHFAVTLWSAGEPVTFCTCGARWTHPASRLLEEIKAIYQSHLRYANHAPITTL